MTTTSELNTNVNSMPSEDDLLARERDAFVRHFDDEIVPREARVLADDGAEYIHTIANTGAAVVDFAKK